MNITFQEKPVTLKGTMLKKGDTMPEFTVVNNDLETISSKDMKGIRILLSVPSLDTGVCSMEVAKFMEYMKSCDDVTCYSISMDLPFALGRWCQAKENERVITASDYKEHAFAKASGTYIEELGLLTRAVFVVDQNNKIQHVEYVSEVTQEPNYDAVLNTIAALK